ncbi:hypothetical protein CLU79DRAFT_723701 [Phycomyces nitens]|nr:hypothetical protein CLU79DRAFT_723701 [Phycomyces nitens]
MWRSLGQCRLLHTSVQRSVWNKTFLKKLKKTELSELAQKHDIDATGTKNELITRLASYTKPTQDTQSTQTTQTTPPTPPTPATLAVEASTPAADDADLDWAKGFDLKSLQRSSRPADKRKTLAGQPHPLAPKTTEPIKPPTPTVEPSHEPEVQSTIPEDVNAPWVKAFEQKVGTHGARVPIDTIMPASLEILDNESPVENPKSEAALKQSLSSPDKKEDWAPASPQWTASDPKDQGHEDMLRDMLIKVQQEQAEAIERENAESELHRQKKNAQSELDGQKKSGEQGGQDKKQSGGSKDKDREIFINGAIGASVLVWLTMGEDGLKKLFWSSSS